MPITVSELIESRHVHWDSGGRMAGTRVFKADAPPDTVKITAPAGLPNPVTREPFPTIPTLRCIDVDADYWPGSVGESKITATYSTEDLQVLPSDNRDSWSVAFRNDLVSNPIFIWDANAYAVSNGAGNPPTLVPTWVVDELKHTESRTIYIRRVVITAFNPDVVDAVEKQIDRLHHIGNRWVRFMSGDITWQSSNRWNVDYQWEYDAGTPDYGNSTSSDIVIPSGFECEVTGMYPGTTFARPPFHRMVVVPGASATDLPATFAKCPYAADPTGYSSLPGWT